MDNPRSYLPRVYSVLVLRFFDDTQSSLWYRAIDDISIDDIDDFMMMTFEDFGDKIMMLVTFWYTVSFPRSSISHKHIGVVRNIVMLSVNLSPTNFVTTICHQHGFSPFSRSMDFCGHIPCWRQVDVGVFILVTIFWMLVTEFRY